MQAASPAQLQISPRYLEQQLAAEWWATSHASKMKPDHASTTSVCCVGLVWALVEQETCMIALQMPQ
jgi:hypothetical protein